MLGICPTDRRLPHPHPPSLGVLLHLVTGAFVVAVQTLGSQVHTEVVGASSTNPNLDNQFSVVQQHHQSITMLSNASKSPLRSRQPIGILTYVQLNKIDSSTESRQDVTGDSVNVIIGSKMSGLSKEEMLYRSTRDLQAHHMSVRIETTPPMNKPLATGTPLHVQCVASTSADSLKFVLLRQRLDQQHAHPVDEADTHSPTNEPDVRQKVQEFRLVLREADNGAVYFCEAIAPGIPPRVARSAGVYYNVTFPPKDVHVIASPVGAVGESVSKQFVCQLSETGSNPPSELEWTQLDVVGALLPMTDVHVSTTEQLVGTFGAFVARSNLTVTAKRTVNGRRFECNVKYMHKATTLRAEEMLEVRFSPNNVRLIAQPMGGVRESTQLDLTCTTSSCHPPATIRWFQITPPVEGGDRVDDPIDRSVDFKYELTDLAQLDTNLGEFGGTKVASKLTITNTYRTHQNTIYRCQVEHSAMQSPITHDHRLQILYPATVKVIGLPSEPVIGQAVILSCQTTGGNPQLGFKYSWFVADRSQAVDLGKENNRVSSGQTPSQNTGDQSASYTTTQISAQLHREQQPAFDQMIRLSGHQEAQLNLSSSIKLSQRGWYACEAASDGGESHAFSYLEIFYPPTMDRRTKSYVAAGIGESASLVLYVDANPAWADASWFQMTNVDHPTSSPTTRTHNQQVDTFYESEYPHDTYYYHPDLYGHEMRRFRSTRTVPVTPRNMMRKSQRIPVGTSAKDRGNIVAERGYNGIHDNLTFSLNFYGIRKEDFGEYLCLLRHRLGTKEFHFHLIKKPDSSSILPESVTLVQHGSLTVVRFRPLHTPPYTRVVLRVCRRDAAQSSMITNPSSTHSDVGSKRRDLNSHSLYPRSVLAQDDGKFQDQKDTESVATLVDGCDDYQVAKPLSGQTEVHLSESVQLYNFRLLLYRGTQVLQETPAFLWQPEISTRDAALSGPLVALAVAGGVVIILVLSAAVGMTYAHRNRKRKTGSTFTSVSSKNVIPSINVADGRCGEMPANRTVVRRLIPGFEMHSDLGSVRSFAPSELETIPLMPQGITTSSADHQDHMQQSCLPNFCSPLAGSVSADYGSRTSMLNGSIGAQGSAMGLLSNRVFAEAYLAASRAASAAVAASVMSNSTDLYAPSTPLAADPNSPVRQDGSKLDRCVARPLTHGNENTTDCRPLVVVNSADGEPDATNSTHEQADQNRSQSMDQNSEYRLGVNKHRSDLPNPRGSRGSRLSDQSAIHDPPSQWSSLSGTSFVSLNSPSQVSLEAAARAAAVAAVASVMQNMNMKWMMQHAASSNNLNAAYAASSRPASRAASVAGPTGVQSNGKTGNESGDGESLHSVGFTRRCTSSAVGEVTPTASLRHIDPTFMMAPGSHLAVPAVHRQPLIQRTQPASYHEVAWGYRYGGPHSLTGHQRMGIQGHGMVRSDANYLQRPRLRVHGSKDKVPPRAVTHRGSLSQLQGFRVMSPPHPQQMTFRPTVHTAVQPLHLQYMTSPDASHAFRNQQAFSPIYNPNPQHPAYHPLQNLRTVVDPFESLPRRPSQHYTRQCQSPVIQPNHSPQSHSIYEEPNNHNQVGRHLTESNSTRQTEPQILPPNNDNVSSTQCEQPETGGQCAKSKVIGEEHDAEGTMDAADSQTTSDVNKSYSHTNIDQIHDIEDNECSATPCQSTTPVPVRKLTKDSTSGEDASWNKQDMDTASVWVAAEPKCSPSTPGQSSTNSITIKSTTHNEDPMARGHVNQHPTYSSRVEASSVVSATCPYKQQPRLGIQSATRLNKSCSRNNEECGRLMMEVKPLLNAYDAKQKSTTLTNSPSDTPKMVAPDTNGFHTQ